MDELLPQLVERIKPKNGLVINEVTWAKAHDYHYNHLRAHLLAGHGSGIITGLEINVIQDEPAEVSIKPGMAIDPQGRIIILAQQTSLMLSTEQAGLLYVYLEADEEREVTQAQAQNPNLPTYVRGGRHLDARLSLPPAAIELARIRLAKANAPIHNPLEPALPGPNELDQRFRPEVGAHRQPQVGVAIIYLGQETGQYLGKYGIRAKHLATALSHLTHCRVCFDDDVALLNTLPSLAYTDTERPTALPYTLLYLVEQGAHVLEPDFKAALFNHYQAGGTLLIESYQEDSPLLAFFTDQKIQFQDELNEPLLTEPFLFSTSPAGANSRSGKLRFAEGLLFSTCDYGRLWQRTPGTSREVIRAATEWGANLIAYAFKRQQKTAR